MVSLAGNRYCLLIASLAGIDAWFHFDPQWWPVPHRLAPPAPSPALTAALSSRAVTPGDIAQVIHAGAPRKLVIDGTLVDAPSGPSDPRGPERVARVAAELRKARSTVPCRAGLAPWAG